MAQVLVDCTLPLALLVLNFRVRFVRAVGHLFSSYPRGIDFFEYEFRLTLDIQLAELQVIVFERDCVFNVSEVYIDFFPDLSNHLLI